MLQLPSLANIKQTTIETERLLLKEITPNTMKQLFTSFTDAEIMAFLSIETKEELEMERKRYNDGLSWYRATSLVFIIADKQTGKRLGKIGYHTWAKEHSRAEIGYHIDRDADKGKGYMTEAMKATIAYGFSTMGLNRIEALVSPNNEPSIKLMTRFGFTKEGILRSHYFKNGIMEDSGCFGLLQSEYNEEK